MTADRNGTGPRIIPVGQEPPAFTPRPPRAGRPTAGESGKAKGQAGTGERFRIINTFADFTLSQLSRAEIAVWLLLWRDTRDGTARTGITDLARRAGCDRGTVFRALKRLEQLALVSVVRRGGLRRGPSAYRVRPLAKDD